MIRLAALLLFILFSLSSSAQELTVKSFRADPMDLSAASKPVSDLNGKACALVKVWLAVDGATFDGSIIKTVKHRASEYWVYMTDGTYRLTVNTPGYLPMEINFRDYGVRRVMSKQTYVLTLLRPDAVPAAASASPSASSSAVQSTASTVGSRVPVPEAVDLGLSVKWASFNLGASKPEETGHYYKWGETEPADSKGWATYKYAKGAEDKLTKYCSDSQYGYNGFTDGRTVLEAADDAATVNLGGAWRMPTSDEIKELVNKCKREWTKVNGVNGIRVTGPNGNTIFFPASGYRSYSDGSLYYVGSYGYFWSATPYSSYNGRYLYFGSSSWGWNYYGRADGFPVRPVLGK